MTDRANLGDLTSKKGWIKVAYDQTAWIPCPPRFRADMSQEEWAGGYAKLWWDASGIKHGKSQVKALEQALVALHENIYGHQPCHLVLIHLTDVRLAPLPVCFGIWQTEGDPDTQLRALVHVDEPAAIEPPMVEEIRTESLGHGLKCLYYQQEQPGPGVLAVLNYGWRSEELETALHVYTACPDLGRLQQAMPDIDEMTRAITFVPSVQ